MTEDKFIQSFRDAYQRLHHLVYPNQRFKLQTLLFVPRVSKSYPVERNSTSLDSYGSGQEVVHFAREWRVWGISAMEELNQNWLLDQRELLKNTVRDAEPVYENSICTSLFLSN